MSYRTANLPKIILTLGICFFAIGAMTSSSIIAQAQDPATPNTPGMGIPSSTNTGTTTNNIAPAVPTPKAEIVPTDAIVINRGVSTQDFKPGSDTVTPTTTGGTNDIKASDLTIQKSAAAKQAQATTDAVRTGSVSVFFLVAAPVAVMFWYQYRFIRSRKTRLATTEEKISTSVEFDKK